MEKKLPKNPGYYWIQYYSEELGHLLEPMYWCGDAFNGLGGIVLLPTDKRIYGYYVDEIDFPEQCAELEML